MMRNMLRKITFKIISTYRHSTVHQSIIFIIDLLLATLVFFIIELFQTHDSTWNPNIIAAKFCEVITVCLVSFLITGTHKSIIRHSGLNDITRILVACGIPIVALGCLNFLNNHYYIINQNILLGYREVIEIFFLLAIGMISVRLMAQRIYNDYFRRRRPITNLVIYGAGAAGMITYNALQQDLRNEYNVVAFIDDDPSKAHQTLNGIPIMKQQLTLTEQFLQRNNVSLLIIAIPSIRTIHKQAIANKALSLGLTVKSVPHISTWINGEFTYNQIENIKIEDLLGRDSIKLDNANVIRSVSDKVILVTGAAGSIGSEICRQLIQYHPKQLIMLDQAETPMYDLQFELRSDAPYRAFLDRMVFVIANIKDERRMREVFEHYHPQIIYHAAAYKHVPFMEENPYESVYVNVFGTKNIADLAIEFGAEKFVMISTDKAVNPTNVMGTTKRMAEIYIQSRKAEKTHFITTRFGNVLGSNGSVIPLFKKQLASGGPLTVTHRDIIRYFMTIPEACGLVLEASAMGEGDDIFVFDMGQPVKIYDMAKRMIQLSGRHNIEIKEVGLRPGEKLYEELLATKENTIPTYHPKIMHAMVRQYASEEVDKAYRELEQILASMDDMQIVAKMKAIVPEFVSNNSIYCQLDKERKKEEQQNQ